MVDLPHGLPTIQPLHQQPILSSIDCKSVIHSSPSIHFEAPSLSPSSGQTLGVQPSSQPRGLQTVDDLRMPEYTMSSYHMSTSHDAYLAGQMHQNTPNYAWTSRQSLLFQPSVAVAEQSFPHVQPLPSSSFPTRYNTQQSSHLQGYYHPAGLSQQHLSAHAAGRVYQPRSSPVPPPIPSNSVPSNPPTLPDQQQFMHSSQSYVLNHSEYRLPEASSLYSHPLPMPVNSHPHPPTLMTVETVYSSPESVPTSSSSSEPEHQVRVISSRPRPQCWDHGCNGREFSTFSNLLRHQRERSGVTAKAECPICGAGFTRTTARNIHVAQGKCKGGGREAPAE